MDAIVGSIAAAVEEQSVITAAFAENVGHASVGVQQVNESVAKRTLWCVTSPVTWDRFAPWPSTSPPRPSPCTRTRQNLSGLAANLDAMISKFKI